MASSAYNLQLRRRQAEDAHYHSELKIKQDNKLEAYADWEVKTSATIAKNTLNARASQLAQREVDGVQVKRERINRLYDEEMEVWVKEIEGGRETLEEHKERIRERAHMLKDKREDERKQFVQQMYQKQWRSANDDARTLDSAALTTKLLSDRRAAIDYREGDGKIKEREESERQNLVWKGQMRELDEKERRDVEMRHERNVQMRRTLDEQCEMLRSKKMELKGRNDRAEQDELEQWRVDEVAEQEKQQRLLEAAYARGQATKAFNAANTGRAKVEKSYSRREDLVLLEYAMEKEQSEIKKEWQKKQDEKHTAQRFKVFLEEQMIKEAEDTKDVDEYRRIESEKIWLKRDSDKQRQDDARSLLMHEVDVGRREQMRLKAEKEEDDRTYFHEQIALDKIDWDRQEAEIQDKAYRVKTGIQQNQVALKNQIGFRERVQAREEQEKFLENKQMAYMERMHKLRLKEQAGIVIDRHPRKHTNWYT